MLYKVVLPSMPTALPLPYPKLSNISPRRQRQDENPRTLLEAIRSLTWLQWALFFSGWLSWTCDGLDFYSVSLSVVRLTVEFDKPVKDITTAITLTLLLRSVGALIFGLVSDQFGRKWPLVINLLMIAAFELGSGLAQTFEQFLVLRAMFGIAMGGIWGMASATALENLPVEVRGFASGVIQQGSWVGYIIAATLSIYVVPETKHGWRILFYAASGISLSAAIFRAALPEPRSVLLIREAKAPRRMKRKFWIKELKDMLKMHWILFTYAVLFMSGMTFLAHASQDLYPTFLQTSKGLSSYEALVGTIIANLGNIVGSVFAGILSQQIGRRLTIIIFLISSGAFIPLWILPDTFSSLAAGAFFFQFGVGASWGIVPIQLAEISPPASRATFGGVTYQIGNMVSSASAQIEAVGGEHLTKTVLKGGKPTVVPDYGIIQAIFIGVIVVFLIIITVIGPERHGSDFERQIDSEREAVGQRIDSRETKIEEVNLKESEAQGHV